MNKNTASRNESYESEALLACLEIGKLLTSTLDFRQILERIMIKVSDTIAADHWSLLLKDEATGELTFEIVVGPQKSLLEGLRLAPGEGIAGYAAERCDPLVIANVREDPRFSTRADGITGFVTKSVICVPLETHGKAVGVIEIVNVVDMPTFEEKDLPVLKILADYAAIAIENSRLFQEVERLSITDEYTGLHNARYLYQVLDGLMREARVTGSSIAVVFVDIDNFKSVVDTHGHLLGSRVLKEIGETISECLLTGDLVIKYGGDEYVMILPGRQKDEAREFVERIRQAVRNTVYLESAGKPLQVSGSFGIAMYPDDAESLKDVLLAADDALYHVKKTTKDGVATA